MEMITLSSADRFECGAYEAKPSGSSLGGLVVLQEIFGLTDYITSVCDYWASVGYHAIAPALYDRVEPGAVVDYADMDRGRSLAGQSNVDDVQLDIDAARRRLLGVNARVAVLGFCWGGGLAYRASATLDFNAAIVVYGTRLLQHKDRTPRCPVQFHFGEHDAHVPADVRAAMASANPDSEQFLYDAGHGFDRQSASEADRKTRDDLRENIRAFLGRHVAGGNP